MAIQSLTVEAMAAIKKYMLDQTFVFPPVKVDGISPWTGPTSGSTATLIAMDEAFNYPGAYPGRFLQATDKDLKALRSLRHCHRCNCDERGIKRWRNLEVLGLVNVCQMGASYRVQITDAGRDKLKPNQYVQEAQF